MRSAIILVGGRSSRFGSDKGLTPLLDKPLILHIIENLSRVVDEIIVVISDRDRIGLYSSFGGRIVVDAFESSSPIVGAYTGLMESKSEYSFLTGGDYPLVNGRIVELLFERAEGHDASTPAWPNGWLEPLHAIYRSKKAANCAEKLIADKERKLGLILRRLPDVVKVSIDELRRIDPELYTLLDVDTTEDLLRADQILRKKNPSYAFGP